MQNNQDTGQNSTNSGKMVIDIDSSLQSGSTFTYLRNGIIFSQEGNFLFAQNEMSNRKVAELPYPCIGHIAVSDGTWVLFTTDDKNSEIGIFDESTFTYTKKLNAPWLNFNRSFLITGGSKQNSDCSYSIYWADGRRNPDRVLNLSKVGSADFDSIRQAKLTNPPTLDIQKSTGGTLPNGSYQAVIAYSMGGVAFTEYYSLTLPVAIWNEDRQLGALDITIDGLDSDFDFFDLVIIQTSRETVTAKRIGTYPRATGRIHVASFDRPDYIPVDVATIPITNQPWIASDQISSNNQYLFKVGTETIPELNYQQQAFQIQAEYVITRYRADYYEDGNNVGHYRDEVYAYWVQKLHKTGYWSSLFTIPGREAEDDDLLIASGQDVYEALIKDCEEKPELKVWQVENTASEMISLIQDDTICDGIEIGYGTMGYHESTDSYPDNLAQFGPFKNTKIRHHRMPNEAKAPRYEVIDGKPYINVLGVRFKNIPRPLKADGTIDEDWVGYRIVRADRRGNKTVISRGLLTNVRGYKERQGSEQVDVMYQNYPYNDLRPDSYISQKQTTFKNNKEQNFEPLATFHQDRFNFHSPHTTFMRYGLGEELSIESEEVADVNGKFTEVYQHPRHKLLSLFSFWIAAAMGGLQAILVAAGKGTTKSWSELNKGTGGLSNYFETEYPMNTAEDIIGLNITQFITDSILAGNFSKVIGIVKTLAIAITSLGLKALTFTFFGIQYADMILTTIDKFLGNINYTLQYNSHAFFNRQEKMKLGDRRRFVNRYQFLQGGITTIDGKLFNNFGSQDTVYLETNLPISLPINEDNSRRTLSEFGLCDDIFANTTSQASAYYVTSKRKIPNQYGRIESNISFVLTHNNFFKYDKPNNPDLDNPTFSTPTIYGGDCYIVRVTQQTKRQFFTQDQAGFNDPDGTEFNYLNYRNVGYPRYWANFFKYDFSELISRNMINFTRFSRTVASRHNLDCKGGDDTNAFRVDDAYFYLYNNGVLDYFAECDHNFLFREKAKNDTLFYSSRSSSLEEIFRSDRLKKPEEFNFDPSLSIQANQIYAQQQLSDYNPDVYSACYKYSSNRLLYSLPAYQEQKYDNWQRFLTGNTYEFPKSEFGNLTSMHRVDGERILFLFDRSSPYITIGRSQLQVTNETITIGDGGLFAQPPKEMQYTQQHYGNSQSRWGSLSTHFGTFFPAERQGRLFKFAGNLDEVTRNGIHAWSKEYFPVKLKELFPKYKDSDNPVIGTGYISAFDASIDMIYITKRDFYPKPEYVGKISYSEDVNKFFIAGRAIDVRNLDYFDDISFTISYCPSTNGFVSFHDWHPDWVLPIEKHFLTFKGTDIYLHNDNPIDYNTYYGKKSPFEIEFTQSNKFQVETLSDIEYYMECFKYKEDGINKVHVLDDNFSHCIIHNTEQISGLLHLNPKGNPYTDIAFPKATNVGFETLYSKVENKYRVNGFFDITKNRKNNVHLMHYKLNGYERIVNPQAIDPFIPPYERALFRHYDTKIWLGKSVPTNKMIFKLAVEDQLKSPR